MAVYSIPMPPAMPKTTLTSVRDRVAAIESNVKPEAVEIPENSIIRARYVPDVKGVNRYKHFYVANGMETSRALKGHTERSSNGELPSLIQAGRVRPHNNVPDNGYENNGVEKSQRKSPRRVNLPQLNGSPRERTQKEKDIVDYVEHQARHALTLNTTEPEVAEKQPRNIQSGRLTDHLSITGTAAPTNTGKRTFAQLGIRQNGVIINRPLNSSLDVVLPPRSQSAHVVSEQAHENLDEDEELVVGSKSDRDTRDSATQTTRSKRSTTSVEFLDPAIKMTSTQTEAVPIVIVPRRKPKAPVTMVDVEERETLFNVIEEALGETIDRYSRTRTNQIIANSARKQAQIWRDAKDFIACTLVPQSIQMANQSRSASKTTAEIVASIKFYP